MENKFVNDGSFMAMFKKRMEQEQMAKSTNSNGNLAETEKNHEKQPDSKSKSTNSQADSTHCYVKQTQQSTENSKQPISMSFNQQVQDDPSRISSNESAATCSDEKGNDNGNSETGTVSTSLDELARKKYAYPIVGKRRGKTPALKTGAVKKIKTGEEKVDSTEGDAWSKYMAEVKKYSTGISNEDKTRPLVK